VIQYLCPDYSSLPITTETELTLDLTYWNEVIIPELKIFVHGIYLFLNDPVLQDQFMETPDDQKTCLVNSILRKVRSDMNDLVEEDYVVIN
jgi:hypothetical protein